MENKERKLIIEDIQKLRSTNNNFAPSVHKWKDFYITTDDKSTHLSGVSFTSLPAELLISTYKRILKYHFSQS